MPLVRADVEDAGTELPCGLAVELEIDGGINLETAPLAAAAGADILVAGSAVFGAPDSAAAARAIRAAAWGA